LRHRVAKNLRQWRCKKKKFFASLRLQKQKTKLTSSKVTISLKIFLTKQNIFLKSDFFCYSNLKPKFISELKPKFEPKNDFLSSG